MPREEDRPVQESVLDRLIGDDAEVSAITRTRSVRDLKAAVRRDLEWLLNTRAVAIPPPESLSEVRESVYTYGVSDITSLSADDPKARARLRSMIEEAIRDLRAAADGRYRWSKPRRSRGKRASFASPSRPC